MSRSVLSLVFLLLWFCTLVNAAVLQLQAYVFAGSVVVPAYFAKLLLAAFFVVAALCFERRHMPRRLLWLWCFYMAAVVASFLYAVLAGHMSLVRALTLYLANNLFLIMLPFAFTSVRFLRGVEVERLLLLLAFPLCLLGLAQALHDEALIFTDTDDGGLLVQSWLFYGHVRSYSLFSSGLDFSFFLALVAAVATVGLMRERAEHQLFSLLVLGLVVISTYTTYTRLAYIFVAQTIFFSAFFCLKKNHSRLIWALYPLVNLAASVAAVVIVPLIMSGGMVRNDTLLGRLRYWQQALDTVTSQGAGAFLLGTGITQGGSNAGYIVDNMFLNFMVQLGVLGMLAVVALLMMLWMSLRPEGGRPLRGYAIAVAALWSTWMCSNFFNTLHTVYLLALLPILVERGLSLASEGERRERGYHAHAARSRPWGRVF